MGIIAFVPVVSIASTVHSLSSGGATLLRVVSFKPIVVFLVRIVLIHYCIAHYGVPHPHFMFTSQPFLFFSVLEMMKGVDLSEGVENSRGKEPNLR
jgi:hypothetical protein